MFSLKKIQLFRSLSNACRAGQSAGKALRQYAQREGQSSLLRMAEEIEGGGTFSEAMRRRPGEFPPWQAEAVAAGEGTGRLDEVLGLIAQSLEERRRFWLKVLPKCAYPVFILHFIPVAMNAQTLVNHGPATFFFHCLASLVPLYLAFAVIYLAARSLLGLPGLRRHLPFAGSFLRAALAHYLALLVRAGLSLSKTVELAGRAAGLSPEDRGLRGAAALADRGGSMAAILAAFALFDQEDIDYVQSAEEAGKLDSELARLHERARERNEAAVSTLLNLIPTLILLAVAAVVALKVIGFYKSAYSSRMGQGVLF
ncbi:MAG: hypothetical protein A2X36_14745 [Elusimicrobia bacterium GWA2_69_24]|nr:MAG: hypothetical protein A2X36_14745 [Elusimicrobia bacterium GWA2_69_24]